MIISRTPFRLSFFGGGTDYPQWFLEHGGAVLATTINKYCYISARHLPPFFEHRHRIVWSQVELVRETREIQHPVIRATLQEMAMANGLEIHHEADLPARSGLGSSSTFTVGLIHALQALQQRMTTCRALADAAMHIEQNVLGEHVGCQDQISAAFGGFNRIDFHRNGSYELTPVILPPDRLQELEGSLMLFFSGITRFSSNVAKKKIDNLKNRTAELTTLHHMVPQAVDMLQDVRQPMENFGALLHHSWALKRQLSDAVTNPQIDEIYDEAMSAGASGGKLMGAGGGGFMFFVVRPSLRKRVRERLRKLVHVDFRFDHTGSKILVFEPDQPALAHIFPGNADDRPAPHPG